MAEAPTGTVTFLFTDVEGSTRLWEQAPAAMRAAMARHDELIESCVAANAGRHVRPRGEGDSRFAVFPRATDAVSGARDVQRALAAEPWPLPRPIRARIALHTGEADLRAGDYYGSEVNRCARLRSIAAGGQTLLSQVTYGLVQDSLPDGVEIQDLGEHRLKDLQRPERVLQLLVAGLPADFPPLKSVDAFPNNLPIQLTSFVGREREVAEVEALLTGKTQGGAGAADSAPYRRSGQLARLVTLTGPGGTGKTRLSLQAGADVLEAFADGVWLVELAPLSDPVQVVQAAAVALGVPQLPGRAVRESLVDFLRAKKLLLLLDNCEHLIEECAVVATALLSTCPALQMVATSREPLGISGETVYRVPSLDLPSSTGAGAAALLGSGAVQLFCERAAAARPSFRLTDANARAVAQICARLDGIPLAIELAAARVKALSPEQIATRLDDRFRLLTGGSRTSLPRQQTLRALIDWSYDLLSESERILLRRLSVFVGSWSLEAAEAVCGDAEGGEVASPPAAEHLLAADVLDLLTHLVDKSLVIADDTDEGETRYRFLETIRQYARDKLLEAGEAEAIRDRHVAFFLQLSSESGPLLRTPEAVDVFRRLRPDEGNFISAAEWASDRAPESALAIAGNLIDYRTVAFLIAMRAPTEEAIRRIEQAAGHEGTADRERDRALCQGLVALSSFQTGQGDLRLAISTMQRGIAIAREIGDLPLLTRGLVIAASVSAQIGDFEAAAGLTDEAILVARTVSRFDLATALMARGRLRAMHDPDDDQARADMEEGLRLALELHNSIAIGMSSIALAGLFMSRGEFQRAEDLLHRSLEALRRAEDNVFQNVVRSRLADLARETHHYALAAERYREVIASHQIIGNRGGVARCLECLAFMEIEQGQAASDGERDDHLRRAARLFGAAEALREASGAQMGADEPEEYERYLAQLRELLDAETLTPAWREGRSLSVEEAIKQAA